jgi:hypothetical protein
MVLGPPRTRTLQQGRLLRTSERYRPSRPQFDDIYLREKVGLNDICRCRLKGTAQMEGNPGESSQDENGLVGGAWELTDADFGGRSPQS